MRTITFYSYKGGTGRSLTLVNVAYALGLLLNKRVGVVDLDCEAAALHDLFQVDPGSANLLKLLQPRNRSVPNLEYHIIPVPLNVSQSKDIFLLPTITDASLIDEIHWDAGVEAFLESEALPTFGRVYDLDYLLIDARAGVSSFAHFSIRICDFMVIVGRADRQNIYGLKRMFAVCKAAKKPFMLVLSGCPSPERNRGKVEHFTSAIDYKPDIILPYSDDLYFDEKISMREEPSSNLAKKYGEIARIIDTRVSQLP